MLDILKLVDTQTPVVQLIDVPKISHDSIQRAFGGTVGGSADCRASCLVFLSQDSRLPVQQIVSPRTGTFQFQFPVVASKIVSLILVWQLLPQFRVKSLSDGFFELFQRSKLKCGGRREFECTGTRVHPRRRLMAKPLWLMTGGSLPGGTSTLSIPSGIRRGDAEVVGVRGQGLGIPWPFPGCPCRLRGRLKILELWRRGSHCGAQCCSISADPYRRSLLADGSQLVLTSGGVPRESSVLSRYRVARRPLARMAVMVGIVAGLRVTLLRNAWLDSGYVLRQFLGGLDVLPTIFT